MICEKAETNIIAARDSCFDPSNPDGGWEKFEVKKNSKGVSAFRRIRGDFVETFASCDINGTASQIIAGIRLNISGDYTDVEADNQGQTRYRRIKTPFFMSDRDIV